MISAFAQFGVKKGEKAKADPLEHRSAASKQPQSMPWHAWHFGKAHAMGICTSSYRWSLYFYLQSCLVYPHWNFPAVVG